MTSLLLHSSALIDKTQGCVSNEPLTQPLEVMRRHQYLSMGSSRPHCLVDWKEDGYGQRGSHGRRFLRNYNHWWSTVIPWHYASALLLIHWRRDWWTAVKPLTPLCSVMDTHCYNSHILLGSRQNLYDRVWAFRCWVVAAWPALAVVIRHWIIVEFPSKWMVLAATLNL